VSFRLVGVVWATILALEAVLCFGLVDAFVLRIVGEGVAAARWARPQFVRNRAVSSVARLHGARCWGQWTCSARVVTAFDGRRCRH